jgi:hypothetical protein
MAAIPFQYKLFEMARIAQKIRRPIVLILLCVYLLLGTCLLNISGRYADTKTAMRPYKTFSFFKIRKAAYKSSAL